MESSWFFLVIAIVAVGLLALIAMTLTGKHSHTFNVEEYQTRWLKIENSLNRNNPATFTMAVINGDKLLDRALTELGLPGKTMGDRLKRLTDQGRLEKPNAVWSAHKLRNQIAHESDFDITYEQASHALAAFRGALKDLGAI